MHWLGPVRSITDRRGQIVFCWGRIEAFAGQHMAGGEIAVVLRARCIKPLEKGVRSDLQYTRGRRLGSATPGLGQFLG